MNSKRIGRIGLFVFAMLVLGATVTLMNSFERKQTMSTPAPVATAQQFAPNILVFEAMWTAGGSEYKAAVNKLAVKYAVVMDAKCQVGGGKFDVSEAANMYQPPFTPMGMEKFRDELIKKQVAFHACNTMYGEKRAAQLLATSVSS